MSCGLSGRNYGWEKGCGIKSKRDQRLKGSIIILWCVYYNGGLWNSKIWKCGNYPKSYIKNCIESTGTGNFEITIFEIKFSEPPSQFQIILLSDLNVRQEQKWNGFCIIRNDLLVKWEVCYIFLKIHINLMKNFFMNQSSFAREFLQWYIVISQRLSNIFTLYPCSL